MGKPKIELRKPGNMTADMAAFIGGGGRPDILPSEPSGVQMSGQSGIVERSGGRKRRRTTIYLEPNTAKELRLHCVGEGVEMSAFVEEAIQQRLAVVRHG